MPSIMCFNVIFEYNRLVSRQHVWQLSADCTTLVIQMLL